MTAPCNDIDPCIGFDNDSDIMTKPGLNLLPLPIGLFELAVCCHCCYRCLINMDE